jgi:replication factor C large subunit
MLLQWLSENVVYQYEPSLQAIADAYDALSWADVMLSRMKREQQWALLSYALELMTAGVASARQRPPFKFVKYNFPEKLRLLSRMKEQREKFRRAVRLAARNLHVSTSTFKTEILPYIKVIYEHDRERGKELLEKLGVRREDLEVVLRG